MNTKNLQKGQMMIIWIILVVVVGAYFMVGGFTYKPPKLQIAQDATQSATVSAQSSSELSQPFPVTPTSNVQVVSSEEAICSHLDGICHPLEQALCCDRMRALCADEKCTGFLPPLSSYPAGGPTPTINPQCDAADKLCKSFCGNKEGFLCL